MNNINSPAAKVFLSDYSFYLLIIHILHVCNDIVLNAEFPLIGIMKKGTHS